MSTPAVLLVVFNRPETTRRVFQEVRRARPERLYVAADGPRSEQPRDVELVRTVRQLATDVDWPCQVSTLFRTQNLGCGRAVSGAIDWFMENEEEGIILEDDCLPSPGFFDFCDRMLRDFRHDERVMLITGHNKQGVWKPEQHDYFYAHTGGIWGWATWRRAWRHFDFGMDLLGLALERGVLEDLLGDELGRVRRAQLLRAASLDAWAYQWAFARHINSGMSVVPATSLTANIGFGADATHTAHGRPTVLPRDLPDRLPSPIRPNPMVVADSEYDRLFHPSPTLHGRVTARLRRVVGALLDRLEAVAGRMG